MLPVLGTVSSSILRLTDHHDYDTHVERITLEDKAIVRCLGTLKPRGDLVIRFRAIFEHRVRILTALLKSGRGKI